MLAHNVQPRRTHDQPRQAQSTSPSTSQSTSIDNESDEDEGNYALDINKTDVDGKYSLFWNCYDKNDMEFVITAKDVDGEENGSYTDKSFDVKFTSEQFKDRTKFGNGNYKMNGKNIFLDAKEENSKN